MLRVWEVVIQYNSFIEFISLVIFATVHGYFGAWLAVRMLFRPRNTVRFLGIPVFPQGMIPRHRERLAAAIGKAVGEELVSKETVLEELFEKDFLRRKIQSVIDSYTTDILSQNYPSLVESLPTNFREPILESISSLQLKIGKHIQNTLRSEETVQSISDFIEHRVDEFLSKRVSEVIDDEQFNKILNFLETRTRSALRSPALEQKISEFIDKQIDSLAKADTTLGELIKPDTVLFLKEKAVEQIQPIVHHITEIATSERTRNQISSLIKKEVNDYYDNLAFFKKVFVSRENLLGEVDDLVNDSLPKRIEETLRGDYFAQEAEKFIETAIDNVMSRRLNDLVSTIAPEQISKLKHQVKKSAIALLQGDAVENSISAYLTDTLHKVRPHSLDAILQTAYPESEEKLKNRLANGLIYILNTPETANIINRILSKQIDRFLSAPIGRLSDHIPEDKVRDAGLTLTNTIITTAKQKLPEVIQEFNIGEVVREKINKFPLDKLESLVLSVAKEHLRKIELFGAVFGLLLGVGQFFIQHYLLGWLGLK